MLREIITQQSDQYTVQIPKEYINTKVEILVLPFSMQNEIQKNDNSALDELEKIINTKSKNSIKIDEHIIFNPHEELSV
jgi:hypothetical protein